METMNACLTACTRCSGSTQGLGDHLVCTLDPQIENCAVPQISKDGIADAGLREKLTEEWIIGQAKKTGAPNYAALNPPPAVKETKPEKVAPIAPSEG